MHRILAEFERLSPGEVFQLDGDEAAHALKVKRLRSGESVELLNLRGGVARGAIEPSPAPTSRRDAALSIRIASCTIVPPVAPRLDVRTATPKGGRVDDMIDQLTQAGAASWGDLACERSVVEPREHKLTRLERIAAEACKQCGRAWTLDITPSVAFRDALTISQPAPSIVIADASGQPWSHLTAPPARPIRLLIGPEGGFTHAELALARQAGALVTRFGPHTMRIETAAVVATGVILQHASPNL